MDSLDRPLRKEVGGGWYIFGVTTDETSVLYLFGYVAPEKKTCVIAVERRALGAPVGVGGVAMLILDAA